MPDLFVALEKERPLQIAGVINAYAAMLAERAGYEALYLSGSGVATAAFGLPDLALTSMAEVAEETRRISGATSLPLLVDVDTGWGALLMVERTVRELSRAGAAAIQLEDQVLEKRCGHRPNKRLVDPRLMESKICAAAQVRSDPSFRIVARTDAISTHGIAEAVERAQTYAAAGADVIFLEAAQQLSQYRLVVESVTIPVLANITEFGQTPLFTMAELAGAGLSFVLYPLSAFRAMSLAAVEVLAAIRRDGTQANVVDRMQTRAGLYGVLGYQAFEDWMDCYAAMLEQA